MEERDVQVIPHVLVRIDVVEKLRSLDQSDWAISFFRENRKDPPEVVTPGHEISVENDHGLSLRSTLVVNVVKRVVNVSGFSVVRNT